MHHFSNSLFTHFTKFFCQIFCLVSKDRIGRKGEFEDSFEAYYKIQKKRDTYLKITKSWEDFDKEYSKITPVELKELLIVSEIDTDTNQFLSNLKINNNQDFCVQLMSIPEYQLC